jgi:hypothetical protein
MEHLDWAILSHWAQQKKNLLRYAPEDGSSPTVIPGKRLMKN